MRKQKVVRLWTVLSFPNRGRKSQCSQFSHGRRPVALGDHPLVLDVMSYEMPPVRLGASGSRGAEVREPREGVSASYATDGMPISKQGRFDARRHGSRAARLSRERQGLRHLVLRGSRHTGVHVKGVYPDATFRQNVAAQPHDPQRPEQDRRPGSTAKAGLAGAEGGSGPGTPIPLPPAPGSSKRYAPLRQGRIRPRLPSFAHCSGATPRMSAPRRRSSVGRAPPW